MSQYHATHQASLDPRAPAGRGALLQRFLRELREHADPALVPTGLAHPRHRGLSQRQLARALGITVGYYTRLETGHAPWRTPWLDTVAELFTLAAPQRDALYRLALGWTPPPDPAHAHDAQLEALIDAAPFPAQLLSPLGEIEYCNEHLTALDPSLKPGINLTRTILLDPLARERLREWEQDWALPALGNLRATAHLLPEHHRAEMDDLIGELLAAPEVRELWDQHPAPTLGPDPTPRQMNTEHGTRDLYCVVQHPDGHPHRQLIFTIPAEQLHTTPTQAALARARTNHAA